MKRWNRIVLYVAAGLGIGAGLVAAIAPFVIKAQAIRRVEEATGRKLSIAGVSVNPLTWSAGMKGVRLSERDGAATFLAFSSVRVSVSPHSLFRGAPIVSELNLVSPYVSIERRAANSFNFSDLVEGNKKDKGAEAGKTDSSRFCINNITISRGTILFSDRALPAEKRHLVNNLTLKVPFISNMPYLADSYITPHFSAVVNGSPVSLNGKLKKLPASVEVLLGLDVKDISLPYYMAYLPAGAPVAIPEGTAAVTGQVAYRVSAARKPQVVVGGTLSVDRLRAQDRERAPLVQLERGEVAVKEADIFAQQYDIASVTLRKPEVVLARNRGGTWNVARLGGSQPDAPQGKKPPGAPGKMSLHLGSLKVTDGKVTVHDRQPQPEFSTTVEGLSVDVAGYRSSATDPATFALAASTSRREKLAVKGTLVPASRECAATVEAGNLSLASYYPYLSPWLASPVAGKLTASAELRYSDKAGLRAEKGAVTVQSLAAAFGAEEWLRVGNVAVENALLDVQERKLAIERVAVNRSDLRFSRDRSGRLSPLNLLREAAQKPSATAPPATVKTNAPFAWSIGTVAGDQMAFTFRDGTKEDLPEFSLSRTSVNVRNLNGQGKGTVPFKLSTVYGRNGSIALAGDYVQKPASVRGTFDVRRIPLADFESYFPPELNITLADGNADARGKVSFAMREGRWGGGFSADAGIRSFYCLDAEDEDLLKWESLQFEGVTGTLSPFALTISDVVLNHYFAKIVVEENGTLNLQHLMTRNDKDRGAERKEAPASPARPAPPQKGSSPVGHPQSPARSIKIGSVVMQDGILNFTDRHLKPNYAATFYNLGGRVSGLTSEATRFADVDLRGNLENQSPLTITGQINPLRDDLYANIKMRFTDIELSPLSPYSSTYLGYLIDKGKLFLDLTYRIEQKKLESENKVFLDQLTLGSKVDSPQATSLPVRLAIALLKDRNGEIHLDLPVSGRTDDPKFSVWGVVLQMLKNLAVKAATAPFALLQSLFGGKEDFSSVFFGYGLASLSPPEQEKLVKLAGALKDRPVLKIEVSGYVDREHDPEGMRRELLERKVRTEKFLDLVKERRNQPGDSPETMKVSAEEYAKYLKLVYRKEKFPKPRTVIGTVKDLPEAEMKKLILANTVIGTKDLQTLATDRTVAVREFLVDKGKLDPARIFLKSGDLFKEPARQGDAKGRVEFGMAVE